MYCDTVQPRYLFSGGRLGQRRYAISGCRPSTSTLFSIGYEFLILTRRPKRLLVRRETKRPFSFRLKPFLKLMWGEGAGHSSRSIFNLRINKKKAVRGECMMGGGKKRDVKDGLLNRRRNKYHTTRRWNCPSPTSSLSSSFLLWFFSSLFCHQSGIIVPRRWFVN